MITFKTVVCNVLRFRVEPVSDASGLNVFDKDPLTAASCWIQTDHAEAQTFRERPGQTH